jgi:hypothetical protein
MGNTKLQLVVSTLFLLAGAKVLNAFDNVSSKTEKATKMAKAFHIDDIENTISLNDSGIQEGLGKPDHTKIRGSSVKPANAKMVSVPSFMKLRSNERDRDLQSCTTCNKDYIYTETDCGDNYILDGSYGSYSEGFGFGDYKDNTTTASTTCFENACCTDTTSAFTACCIKPACNICYGKLWASCAAGLEKVPSMWDSYYTYAYGCGGSESCCSSDSNGNDCCSLPVPTTPFLNPVSVPVPTPFLNPVPVPVPVPAIAPTKTRTNPTIYIAVGILVSLVIALVVAVICIMNRKKANETKEQINSNNVDSTTVEQTQSAEAPSQATPIKIVSITPVPVKDAPTTVPMMQPDDVSMMTEDNYNYNTPATVQNSNNTIYGFDLQEDNGNEYPVVTGSIVGESVAPKDRY